jgi:hypothetical protein
MGDSDDHAKLGKEIVEEEPEALPPLGWMPPEGVWGLSRWGDAIGRHGKE